MRSFLAAPAIGAMAAVSLVVWEVPARGVVSEQDNRPVSLLQDYHEKALGFRGSWGGSRLIRNGKEVKLGFLGSGYPRVFEGSSGAIASMQTYRRRAIGGFTLAMVGVATVLAEVALIAADPDLFIDQQARRSNRCFGPFTS